MQLFPRSGDAASESTARLLLSRKIFPSEFAFEPIFAPFFVTPRIYHSPSQSLFSHIDFTFSASSAYLRTSASLFRCRAASRKFTSAQWWRNDTMALSPPPRLRQSFQSALNPLQIPLG